MGCMALYRAIIITGRMVPARMLRCMLVDRRKLGEGGRSKSDLMDFLVVIPAAAFFFLAIVLDIVVMYR
jgi:hypothetical protein